MVPIFKELTYRLIYVFVLALLNAIYGYLSLGLQLEYFSSLFAYVYHTSDFCNEVLNFEFCDRDESFHPECVKHASLSWNGLSFSNLLYFYNVSLTWANCGLLAWFYGLLSLSSYVVLQSCAFVLPGVFALGRRNAFVFICLNAMTPLVCSLWALEALCFHAEFIFETFDSELFGHKSI